MRTFLIPVTAVILLLTACASEPIPDMPLNENKENDIPQGTRSLSDALSIANDFFSQTVGTTRNTERIIESIESISTVRTRSNKETPSLYLINYADNAGFALMGANEEAYDIYAISDTGHLALSDTVGNKPLADFIGKAVYHAEAMACAASEHSETRGLIVGDYQYIVTAKVEPMLAPGTQYWHQREPFNKYCYINNARQTMPVGCGPLCLAQLMSYYDEFVDRPKWCKYNGLSLDWNDFAYMGFNEDGTPENSRDAENFAKCLKLLGDLLNCDYTYVYNGMTYTDSQNFLGALSQIGYENCELFLDQPLKDVLNDVKTFMKSGKNGYQAAPLIFYGVSEKGKSKGHFWVVDGYVERQHRNTSPTPIYVKDPILFHCNWGQQQGTSFNNGYYAYLTESDMINAQEYYPAGGKGGLMANPYYEILVIGGYKRLNTKTN